ncbi:MAG: flagellar protein export ATPase FliI [Methylococcales bacterium]|jgi:flagellum-specific ATP synthase|nr:flagellar protein export ATPase FliI [Methylococcales bacterium]
MIATDRNTVWKGRFSRYKARLQGADTEFPVEGKLTRMVGLTLEATGCRAPMGGECVVESMGQKIKTEVVGFSEDKIYLMPSSHFTCLSPNSRVVPKKHAGVAAVGDGLLGRVVDGNGDPLDDKGPLDLDAKTSLHGETQNPLNRFPIREPLDVGIRSINALLSVGLGQRIGLMAGSGVGKSVLLGMMTRYTNADITVVGLIGERGREVKEFVENNLGEEGLKRAVVVVSPADDPPLMRMHGAMLATSIAEYFRAQGKRVLLLMDSLTRFAQAQREIGLAINEPPATKGYPPSVFAKLPQLVERAGTSTKGGGSITAFYTVLAEGDDQSDPIVDASRAILDGHIVLSRHLADSGHYPAIDIEQSISRVMPEITSDLQQKAANRFKQIYSTYQQNRDLITVGAYSAGSDPKVDEAIQYFPVLQAFLQQNIGDAVNTQTSIEQLMTMLGLNEEAPG